MAWLRGYDYSFGQTHRHHMTTEAALMHSIACQKWSNKNSHWPMHLVVNYFPSTLSICIVAQSKHCTQST